MITVLLFMLAGIGIGFLLNRYPNVIRLNDRLISWAIYVLLFLLGTAVGLNKIILQNLDKIGVQAAIITAGAITGSVLSLWIIYTLFFRNDQPTASDEE